MAKELSKSEFIQRLVGAGWSKSGAENEYERIQNEEDESGYDSP